MKLRFYKFVFATLLSLLHCSSCQALVNLNEYPTVTKIFEEERLRITILSLLITVQHITNARLWFRVMLYFFKEFHEIIGLMNFMCLCNT